ncbi:MAG TPA: ADP-glyceromanno-heptose 6-epimerase [Caldithrix abyssi]|uniref:ADP-L-glycero-D-manno-heptose-6-epimerase n=1 Tax=Caldithrix abyssi TaxID=187145 RepID=A0A7V1LNN9_CALAY|nr:ADP-glyceromanno-heptose 6-epimerase [Caldithrix abyssi]
MIIITGAAGFIGSALASRLNQSGERDLLLVDVLRHNDKWKNLRHLDFYDYVDRDALWETLPLLPEVKAIFHMGACSATTESDAAYLMENNYRYTLRLAQYALQNNIRFVYASSAATYGAGERGYADDESAIHLLRPLNMYGYSKQLFDLKARREGWLEKICGIKFFNVYGPNEYHKGDMASVVFKAFNQIRETGRVRLFRSHREDYGDGEQKRDFVYIRDVLEMMIWLWQHPRVNGLFNAGSGRARTFLDLAAATFQAMGKAPRIEFIDMPEDIRDRYQYFTEAPMDKLRAAGYERPATSLEEGVRDYVQNYLARDYRPF